MHSDFFYNYEKSEKLATRVWNEKERPAGFLCIFFRQSKSVIDIEKERLPIHKINTTQQTVTMVTFVVSRSSRSCCELLAQAQQLMTDRQFGKTETINTFWKVLEVISKPDTLSPCFSLLEVSLLLSFKFGNKEIITYISMSGTSGKKRYRNVLNDEYDDLPRTTKLL